MRIRLGLFFFISFCFLIGSHSQNSESCQTNNYTFLPGEEISYIISYNWFVVFAEVGEVNFKIKKAKHMGKEAVHFIGTGNTFNWWDKFFKVRDKYETYVDPETLRPLFFQRNIREGGYRRYVSYNFSDEDTLAYCMYKTNDNPLQKDTVKITPCTFDVLSVLLRTRNIDYSKYKIGEKIPVNIILDLELYNLYYRYQGVETIKLKGYGSVECIKFSILLVEGSMFHEGEDMNVWITNDKNRLPVYIESPILVGSIKVRLANVSGNRYPLSSFK